MKKILLSVLAIGGFCAASLGQDVHFTQYFTSPLTLNPAQTGLIATDWRASANFREQWSVISSNPYTSATVAFDMPTLRGKLPEGDALGVGIIGLFDRAGSGALQNTTFGLSLAYHKSFGLDKQHTLSLGFQGALVQKTIQANKLVFGDQYDPNAPQGYLRELSHDHGVFNNADLTYPDFNAGLMYSGRISEKATVYAGFSYYHLTRPVETFSSNSGNTEDLRIHSRYSAHMGGSFEVNDNVVVYLSGMYHRQGTAQETLLGGAVGFILNPYHDEYTENTIFYLGSWYRFSDAIAPYVGFEWSKMKLGISYDVTMSPLRQANNGQGAWEISLIYNGIIERNIKRSYNFACPKF